MTFAATPLTDASLNNAKALATSLGYETAGVEDIYGQCLAGCTLFLEFDQQKQMVRSWLMDAQSHEYAGETFEVQGDWVAATQHAHDLLSSQYAQERLSDSLERSADGVRVSVTAAPQA